MPEHSPRRTGPDDVRDPAQFNLRALNRSASAPTASRRQLERRHGLRFIVQTRGESTPARIRDAVWREHGLVCVVERMFPRVDPEADVAGLRRFFLLALPGISQRDVSVNVFDLAHRLLETGPVRFDLVEPDLAHAVYEGNPDDRLGLSSGRCNVPDDGAPRDRFWHLRLMRVPEAWALAPPAGGTRFGEGIVVGHPDTGWTEHVELDQPALDLERGWDFLDDDPDARDPLESHALLPRTPGHGTATGSVIVSRGTVTPPGTADGPGPLSGVAPAATLVPIRTMRFPVFVFDGDVARSIHHAVRRGCHVISMSLGGLGTPALEAAVEHAVRNDVIVCAAAGNCVGFVVWPAAYPSCLAVAGCNQHDTPWPHSSRGPEVDITATAEHVWVARRTKRSQATTRTGLGQGTSFAVASLAGVAALWLAFHGRDALLARYGGQAPLQHVFRAVVRSTARRPAGWDATRFGTGIVDAEAVLRAPLPDPPEIGLGAALARPGLTPPAAQIAGLFPEADPAAVDLALGARLGADLTLAAGRDEEQLEGEAFLLASELLHLLAEDRAARLQFELEVHQASTAAAAAAPPLPPMHALESAASDALRARLTSPS
jgi:subtilisin family serine protease